MYINNIGWLTISFLPRSSQEMEAAGVANYEIRMNHGGTVPCEFHSLFITVMVFNTHE
jgi:hypothetical protein